MTADPPAGQSTKPKADFSDLVTRVISAVVLIGVGIGLAWVGGDAFGVLLVIAAGLMGWELSRMHSPAPMVHYAFGLVLAGLTISTLFLPWVWSLGIGVLALGAAFLGHRPPVRVVFWAAAIVVTCLILFRIRDWAGFPATVLFFAIVAASDIGGYFAGKLIGGPKILPKISPKKTWSGTLGGWVLAAIVGGVGGPMVGLTFPTFGIVAGAILLAVAAQIGDLMESLMKRRAGVKDSSTLIPGHGGLLDRFDGVIGAAVALFLALQFIAVQAG